MFGPSLEKLGELARTAYQAGFKDGGLVVGLALVILYLLTRREK